MDTRSSQTDGRGRGAYRVWLHHDRDFTRTAAALGVDEQAVRAWALAGQWVSRWEDDQAAEATVYGRAIAEVDRLIPLLHGVDAQGHHLHVPVAITASAAAEIVCILLSLGAEGAERTRPGITALVPEAVRTLASVARGESGDGRAVAIDAETHAAAVASLMSLGLASRAELRSLRLPALTEILSQRLRQRGFEGGGTSLVAVPARVRLAPDHPITRSRLPLECRSQTDSETTRAGPCTTVTVTATSREPEPSPS